MRALVVVLLLNALLSGVVQARPFGLAEEDASFFPGTYYFHKGCYYSLHGDAAAAIDMWKTAASWGEKSAQYDLGIAYFKGQGVAVDRPRGLAWLALSAERHDEAFESSLQAAWHETTAAEHAKGNATWRILKATYGDAVALTRARVRYETQRNSVTGSHVGTPGHVMIQAREGYVDGAHYLAAMDQQAAVYFGEQHTHVDVGPLAPVMELAPSQHQSERRP